MTAKLCLSYFRFYWKILLRQPSYVLSTLVFPSLFFLIFAHPHIQTVAAANQMMASFCCFAVLSVCILDFGVTLSQERASGWSSFLRTLPSPSISLTVGRCLNALAFSAIAVAIVIMTVFATTDASLKTSTLLLMNLFLLFGAIPFVFIGMLIGKITQPSSALPISNLTYVILSFAGGLWLPPSQLPQAIQSFSEYLPTRHYGEIVWATVREQQPPDWSIVGWTLWALILPLSMFAFTRAFEKSWFRRLRA